MDRIVDKSESCGGVKMDDCTIQRLFYADDLGLLDSTQNGLQQALDRFSDACSVAGMKISTTKTETMCLSRQPKQCSLQIDGVPLKQSEKFKYLGVSFTSDGRQNSELDIRIGNASAVFSRGSGGMLNHFLHKPTCSEKFLDLSNFCTSVAKSELTPTFLSIKIAHTLSSLNNRAILKQTLK